LSKDFNDLLDSAQLPFIAAVELSYLSRESQRDLAEILYKNPELKIDIKKAAQLREFSESNKNNKDNQLTPKIIENILLGISIKKRNRASLPVQSIKIKGKILSKYFKPEHKPEEIEAKIIEAIEFYMAHINENPKINRNKYLTST
jgi:ParB family chromosome partitioning protein